jgi:branched-chain amino acid transport system permease protein
VTVRPWFLPAALAVVAYVVLPLRVDDYWLAVLNLAGIAAVGAVGLNLVTGYAGQLSLGHAAFLGTGAYAAAALGATDGRFGFGLPLPVWLAGAAAAGAAAGLVAGLFAVRVRGHTLAIVTLALVFVGQHVFQTWTSVTGGNAGRADLPSAASALPGSPEQAWFWAVWAAVAAATLLTANVVRSRAGRAMVAVRDREGAAAMLGIDVNRTKVVAFVASSAMAAVAGALYGSYKHYVGPEDWGLLVSIQYLAMVLIGGAGTIAGPVLGALAVTALPRLVEQVSGVLPFVATGTGRGLTVAQLDQLLFGVVIVAFVLAEPRGLAHLGARVTRHRTARVDRAMGGRPT